MEEILYPYLFATLVSVIVMVSAWFAFVRNQKEALVHRQKSERLPDYLAYLDLGDKIAERSQQLEDLLQQVRQADATIGEATEARAFLAQNVDALQQARLAKEDLQKTESQLVTAKEQLALLTEDHRRALQEKHKADFDREQQQRLTDTLKREEAELKAAVASLVERVQSCEEERRNLLLETNQLLAKLGGLRAEVAAVEARKGQLASDVEQLAARAVEAKATIKQLESDEQRLSAIKRQLSVELGDEATRGEDSRDDFVDLRAAVIPKQRMPRPAQAVAEAMAIEKVATLLERKGLRFHQRVLHAFHTSLKVQGESPLLVLAGISGTGKSLLPQCYAEALGIHCHVVPVQPRWDGPQDLLGFYHHLERRYKATPLTHALVQFDRYRPIQGFDENDLSDRILMVVLDEMNLARVEYYFSEFLSRLETRRDVDLETEEGRARAAIPIELGARGGSNRSYPLIVNRNVMFVGTINEDESTQTLSDKVVDRANVLRFGKPLHLAAPAPEDSGSPTPEPRHLLWSTWRQWLQAADRLTSNEEELVARMASQANDALGRIGRAFGHRTFRAIQAYVQHYPRSDHPKGLQFALADQVEQRVLPKLRGIDPTDKAAGDCIRQVLDIVDGLGDEELSRAIEEARQGHSFWWQGLDRKS
jgi:hypothetical protein